MNMVRLDLPFRMCFLWFPFLIALPHIGGSRECSGKVNKDWPTTKVTTSDNWINEAIKVLNSVRHEHNQKLGNLARDDKLCKMAQFCTKFLFSPKGSFNPISDKGLKCICTVEANKFSMDFFNANLYPKDNSPDSDSWINHIFFYFGPITNYEYIPNMDGWKRHAKQNFKTSLLNYDTKLVCPTLIKSEQISGDVIFVSGVVVYEGKTVEQNDSNNLKTKDSSPKILNPSIFVIFVTLILTGLAKTVMERT